MSCNQIVNHRKKCLVHSQKYNNASTNHSFFSLEILCYTRSCSGVIFIIYYLSYRYLQKKWRFYISKKQIEDEEDTNKRILTRWERDCNLGK